MSQPPALLRRRCIGTGVFGKVVGGALRLLAVPPDATPTPGSGPSDYVPTVVRR